jgi:hypothetical protein
MDIKEVKNEIKQDEELLLKVFQLEKFVRKYKTPIIVITAIIVFLVIAKSIYGYYENQKLTKANNALYEALHNPSDKKAVEILKSDRKLYDIYLLQKGEYSKIKSKELSQIKAYEIAMQKGDIKSLENYLNNPNNQILKDAVRLALIRLYLQKGNHKKAVEIANQINPADLNAKKIAIQLIHYGIVK